MSIPGFTAEASIGPTTQVYRVQNRYGIAMASGMYPQLNGGDMGLGAEEDLVDEGAMAMAEYVVEGEAEEDLVDEAAVDMAEQIYQDVSEEDLVDEGAMDITEDVTLAENDEVHVEA
jgi:hypothetical protein